MLMVMNTDELPLPPLPIEEADRAMDSLLSPSYDINPHGDPYLDIGPHLGKLPYNRASFAASNRWHIRNRWRCRKPGWRSIEEIWHNPPDQLKDMIQSGSDNKKIISYLKIRSYVASQFNPHVAACLYDMLCPPGGTVLDPCAGWGDRLAAAMGCGTVGKYTGYDANSLLQEGYRSQIQRYGSDLFSVEHTAFEDVEVSENTVDLVFTCPPYYLAELYSVDPKQSSYRYPRYDEWRDGFYSVLIENSCKFLKIGGYLALAVSKGNYGTDSTCYDLVGDAVSVAASLPIDFLGYMTYPLGHIKTEPILLWRRHGR